MRRGWQIAIGVAAALVVLLAVNTVVTSGETKSAEVTVPGGEIVRLPAGDLQVVEGGPRQAPPIVLIHCFTCAIDWWDEIRPRLERDHRVVAVDLLGHGGSEKPSSGYSISNQADLVAQALARLGVHDATVVGHSLGGPVSIALAEQSPELASRLVIIDSIPDSSYGDVGLIGELPFKPVIGQALWRIKPDFSIRDGLEVAFAPGFDVPDAAVEDVKRMNYSAYSDSHDAFGEYTDEKPLSERAATTGKPLLVLMGAEEQIASDPEAVLDAYAAAAPDAETRLIAGAGHSPNVEKPARTAALILAFAAEGEGAKRTAARHEMQKGLQNQGSVRRHP
jgi:pimeloyl-ACP methyl ester carboxylesterase